MTNLEGNFHLPEDVKKNTLITPMCELVVNMETKECNLLNEF